MLRTQMLRRGFSVWRGARKSTIVRSALHNGHETVTIQRVRIKRPFFSWSRVVGTGVIIGTLSNLSRFLPDDDEEDGREAESRAEDQDGEWEEQSDVDEDEEMETLFFFPTGFSRPAPRTFYKASDPEWQEFVRISRDPAYKARIRQELIATVREYLSKHPAVSRLLGPIDPTQGNTYLEINFPDSPPLEYERPGYALMDDLSFQKGFESVEEHHHERLSRAFYPTNTANAVYADLQARAGRMWKGFQKSVGLESEEEKRREALRTILGGPPLPTGHGLPSSPPNPTSGTAPEQGTSDQTAQTPTEREKEAAVDDGRALERPTRPATDFTLDLSVLRGHVRKTTKPFVPQPPRGAFIVSGLIECRGQRARATIDVRAVYDPSVGKYVQVIQRFRSVTEYKQRPKGGP